MLVSEICVDDFIDKANLNDFSFAFSQALKLRKNLCLRVKDFTCFCGNEFHWHLFQCGNTYLLTFGNDAINHKNHCLLIGMKRNSLVNEDEIKKLVTSVLVEGRTYLVVALPESMSPPFQSLEQNTHVVKINPSCYTYALKASNLPKLTEIVGKQYSNDDYRIGSMSTKEHAVIMLKNWKFKNPFDEHYYGFTCKNGLAFGAFDCENNVWSWDNLTFYGYGGGLRTKPECRNKGLASRILLARSKLLLETFNMDFCPIFIEDDNRVAIEMATKLGFERIGEHTTYVQLFPCKK